MAKLPTGELVAAAYARAVLSLADKSTVPVVTTLPDVSTWATTGAVQVAIVGGVGHDTNLRDMVVSFDAWAARPGSDKPPWGQANELLELIRADAYSEEDGYWHLVPEPIGVYEPVLAQSVKPLTEPRRLADPDTSRAHYTIDIRLFWTVM